MKTISSRQNAVVRMFRALADTADASGAQLLLDGAHLVRDARRAGVRIEVAAVSAGHLASRTDEGVLALELERDGVEIVSATDQVMATISPVRNPSGIAAIARREPSTAAQLCGRSNAFLAAAVDVQDPGNIGSLLRAAEAGGVTGAFVCGTSANPFSWKAVRGSMGSVLRLPVVGAMSADAAFECMHRSGLRTVAAVPRDGRDPDAVDWQGRLALVLGGEGPGLSDEIIARCSERVTIPMAPEVESLNVAVAGAILIYAARRQRV